MLSGWEGCEGSTNKHCFVNVFMWEQIKKAFTPKEISI